MRIVGYEVLEDRGTASRPAAGEWDQLMSMLAFGTNMTDRRIRLRDDELLYLRALVVDQLVREFLSRKKPTYESARGRRRV